MNIQTQGFQAEHCIVSPVVAARCILFLCGTKISWQDQLANPVLAAAVLTAVTQACEERQSAWVSVATAV